MKLELKPEEDFEPKREQQPDLQRETLRDDLEGAAEAEGMDAVQVAIAQVAVGQARPDALLAWIDDLRDPERKDREAVDAEMEQPTGFVADFIPDTALDGAAVEVPPASDDGDYFFSAVRKRQVEEPPAEPPPSEGEDPTVKGH